MEKYPSKHIRVPPLGARGLLLLLFVIAIAVYYAVNPEGVWWFPKCGLYQLTGLKCPICGAQRAAHQFLHGNFLSAFHYNYFLPFSAVYWLVALVITRKDLTRAFYLYCLLAFLWAILRNIIGL